MPNWTHCRLEAPTEVLKKYLAKDEKGDIYFDFNLVIPRPEIYKDDDLSAGGDTDYCLYWYLSNKGYIGLNDILSDYGYMFDSDHEWSSKYIEKMQNFVDSDDAYRRGKKYLEAYNKYGYKTWHDWKRANWGTKWNACDTIVDDDLENFYYVEFDTFWAPPMPVIKKIFEDNPNHDLAFEWMNEDYDGEHRLSRDADGHWELKQVWNENEDINDPL